MKTEQAVILPTQSAATTANSAVIDAAHLYCFSMHIYSVGGTPSGSVQVQGSNDIVGVNGISAPVNFGNISTATALSAAGSVILNFDGQGYRYVRVAYTGGGTGNVTITFFGKGA